MTTAQGVDLSKFVQSTAPPDDADKKPQNNPAAATVPIISSSGRIWRKSTSDAAPAGPPPPPATTAVASSATAMPATLPTILPAPSMTAATTQVFSQTTTTKEPGQVSTTTTSLPVIHGPAASGAFTSRSTGFIETTSFNTERSAVSPNGVAGAYSTTPTSFYPNNQRGEHRQQLSPLPALSTAGSVAVGSTAIGSSIIGASGTTVERRSFGPATTTTTTTTMGQNPQAYTSMQQQYQQQQYQQQQYQQQYQAQYQAQQQAQYQQQTTTTTMQHDPSQYKVISERVIEHEVRVPKKVTKENIVEKVIVVPEKIISEEVIEDIQKIREKIVEVAVPVIQEHVVEVPEIEYVEKIIEVPEVVIQEKVVEVPKIEVRERIQEIPKIVYKEKIIEIPEYEYRIVEVDKIVEVPDIREQIVVKEVPVPQYVEKPVPEYVDVQEEREIVRTIPVPVEAITTCEFRLPKLRPKYTQIDVPLYVPRFVEVPIPLDTMDPQSLMQAESFVTQVSEMVSQSAVSLCEVETLAHTIKTANFEQICGGGVNDPAAIITEHWMNGKLQVDPASMTYTSSNSIPITGLHTSETVRYGKPIHGMVTQEQHIQAIQEQITAKKIQREIQAEQIRRSATTPLIAQHTFSQHHVTTGPITTHHVATVPVTTTQHFITTDASVEGAASHTTIPVGVNSALAVTQQSSRHTTEHSCQG